MSSRKSPPRAGIHRSDSNLRENENVRTKSPSTKTGMLAACTANRMGAMSAKVDKVRKNANGGVLITPEEIQLAFQLLDIEKSGAITMQNLKKRLGVLFPELSVKDYRFLMNNKKDLSLEDLKDLLLENDITNFDPVAEAFRVFDQTGEGALSGDKLREAFMAYGMGELADEELDILIRTADVDGDGAISLEDFRDMVEPAVAALARKGSVTFAPSSNNSGSSKFASVVQASSKSIR